MTSTELKKIDGLLTVNDIVAIGNKLVKKFYPDFNPLVAYPPMEDTKLMSNTRCKMYVRSMIDLFRRAYYLGASDEELSRIAMHRMVLEKAYTDHVNYRQSRIDNDIDRLTNKYDMLSFMQMDFSAIERSNRHYEDC